MKIKVRLADWATPLLYPARYKSVRGGRGSGKSHGFAQTAVLRMEGALNANGYTTPVRIVSARDFETSLDASVKPVVEHYIKEFGLEHRFRVMGNKIVHRFNGSHMIFQGIKRKAESMMSIEGIDVFWMEQAEHLTTELMDLVEPSIRKGTAELWFSWNPLTRLSYCWKRFVENPQPTDVNLHINYNSNPWWNEMGLEELRLYDQKYEPDLYAWKWLGEPNDADAAMSILPYATLEACKEAYGQFYAYDGEPNTYAGLDLAEGGVDKCALVIRQGPNVELIEQWPGVRGDLSVAAKRAKTLCEGYDIIRIYYDAASPIKTDLMNAGFLGIRPVAFGGKVGGEDTFYEPKVTNKAQFARRNIQMADNLRLRANRTLRLVNGQDIDPSLCLFINPRIPRLESVFADFSQPKRRVNPTHGKWELVKAADNEKSPDRYDALSLAYGVDTDRRGLKAIL